MANKEIYKCGICGTEHDTIFDRAKCEMACFEKQKEEARKLAESKKKAEKDARQLEVDKAIEHVNGLIEKFVEDYGSYQYKGKESNHYFRQLLTPFWFLGVN